MINLKQQYIKYQLSLSNRGSSIKKQIPLMKKILPNYLNLMIFI